MTSVFNGAKIVSLHFTECADRSNMAWPLVCQMWLLLQCAVCIMACKGPVLCEECRGPLVQNGLVSLVEEVDNGTYGYVGGRFLPVIPNNSFVSTPLLKVRPLHYHFKRSSKNTMTCWKSISWRKKKSPPTPPKKTKNKTTKKQHKIAE